MEVILGLLGMLAFAWILLGPVLFFIQSSRLTNLTNELARLRREVEKQKAQSAPRQVEADSEATETSAEKPIWSREKSRPTTLPGRRTPSGREEVVSKAPETEVEVVPAVPESREEASPSERPLTSVLRELEQRKKARGEVPLAAAAAEAPASPPSEAAAVPGTSETPPPSQKAAKDTGSFEELVASQWLSWVGAVAVMIGMGYFLKYAIDEGWLGDTGRVALGILGGVATFVGAAYAMKKDYRVLAEGLAGAAMGILYFSLFAASEHKYNLLPMNAVYAGMIVVTAAGLSFAGVFNSMATSVLAMLGGFLTPIMLSKGGGTVTMLFSYILILDLGVLGLATFRSWGKLHLLNFFGTVLMWLGWFANNYKAEDLGITVFWITVFGVVFSLLGMWRHVIRKEISSNQDTVLMLLNPIAYFGALYFLTKAGYSNYHGLFALLVAAYYLGLGAFGYLRNPGQTQVVVTLVGVGLSFVTLAVPLQLSGHWIVMAWAIESLLLIEIGLRYEKPGFRLTGFLLLTIVQVHMILYAGGTLSGPRDFDTGFVRRMWETPVSVEPARSALGGIINGRSMSFAVNAIVLAILAWEYRRREKTDYMARSEEAYQRLGIKSGVPDASRISAILIPMVPVIVLVMGLLETFVHGVRASWTVATHLSMLPIWLSLFALATIVAYRRMMDVTTLGALSKFLFGVTGCLFLVFFLTRFPDWSSDAEAMWGWTLFNPRGFGFLSALTATLVGAMQFSRCGPEEHEGKQIASTLTLAVPLVLLGMCLTETFAFGQRHSWIWATQITQVTIWLAVFAVGTLIAARKLSDSRPLTMQSGLFFFATILLVSTLAITSFGDIVGRGQTVSLETYSRVVANPRALGLFVAAVVLALGAFGHARSPHRNETLMAAFKISIPLTVLMLCLLECYAYGRRDSWLWAGYVSATGIVLALLTVPVRLAGMKLDREPRWIVAMSQFFLVGLAAIIAILFLGTLISWREVATSVGPYWRVPFLNPRGVTHLLAIAAGLVCRKLIPADENAKPVSFGRSMMTGTQLAWFSYAVTFLMCTIEVYAYGKQQSWGTATSLAVTGTWTALAVATIIGGIVKRSADVRMCALGVFGLTTAKVFLYDVWYLDPKIRTVAFIGLGVALMATSFLYRRYRDRIKDWIKPMSLLLAVGLLLGSGIVHAEEANSGDLSTQFTHRFEIGPFDPKLFGDRYDPEFVRIPITAGIYAASRRALEDIRLLEVDGEGISKQVPYVLITPKNDIAEADRAFTVVNQQTQDGKTSVLLETLAPTDPIESLQLTVKCPDDEYVRPLELFGSNEPEGDWRLLVNTGYLIDRRRDTLRLIESTIICPSSQFRYYKLVIDNQGRSPVSVTEAKAHMVRRRSAPLISYPVTIDNMIRTDRKITEVDFTLPGLIPIERVEFDIGGADEYHRAADLSILAETRTTPLMNLQLFHLNGVTSGHVRTASFPEQPLRRMRLTIQNGDDAPLHVAAARVYGIERSIVVPTKSLAGAVLYVGGRVSAPSYDLARISKIPDLERIYPVSLYEGDKNPAYREVGPRKPWAEEHKSLVWILVFAGVIVLSGVAIQLLRVAAAREGGNAPTAGPSH
jgi:hypothetical protein